MNKTLKDYAIVLLGAGFSRSIAFLNSIIIARTLGVEDFGKFSIFFMVMVFTWLIPQSFDSTYVRYAKTSNSPKEKNDFLKVSVFLKLIYAGFILIFCYPIAHILAQFCFYKPEVRSLIIFAMISGIFQAFLMTVASIFQEKEKFTVFSFLYSFYTMAIFSMLMLIKLSKLNFSLTNVIIVHVIVSLIIGAVSLFLLFKKKIKNLYLINKKSLETSISLGKWIFGTAVLTYTFERMDFVFLSRYVNFQSLGVYAVAQQIVMIVSVMTGAISGVFLPKACKAMESEESFKAFEKESFILAVFINSMVIILISITPIALRVLYGNAYIAAAEITRILLIGWIVTIVYLPFGSLFYALDDSKTKFWLEASRFLLAAIFLYFLIPTNGMVGAAWAMSLTLIINSLISLWILKIKISNKFKINAK